MKVKSSRLETLKMLMSSHELSSQEEVLKALQKEGYKLTQATLSRDLKQLKVAKAASMNGKYVYVLPNETMYKRVSKPRTLREMMMSPGFVSINFSSNMVVIKTLSGLAGGACEALDHMDIAGLVGSLAGENTVFLVMKDIAAAELFCQEIREML